MPLFGKSKMTDITDSSPSTEVVTSKMQSSKDFLKIAPPPYEEADAQIEQPATRIVNLHHVSLAKIDTQPHRIALDIERGIETPWVELKPSRAYLLGLAEADIRFYTRRRIIGNHASTLLAWGSRSGGVLAIGLCDELKDTDHTALRNELVHKRHVSDDPTPLTLPALHIQVAIVEIVLHRVKHRCGCDIGTIQGTPMWADRFVLASGFRGRYLGRYEVSDAKGVCRAPAQRLRIREAMQKHLELCGCHILGTRLSVTGKTSRKHPHPSTIPCWTSTAGRDLLNESVK